MLVPERHHTDTRYRYGFQGQEKDDEVKGEGNSINFTFRMYDPRVGRFFTKDPLEYKYPWYTPYQFAGNKPIQFIELEGLEESLSWLAKKTKAVLTVGIGADCKAGVLFASSGVIGGAYLAADIYDNYAFVFSKEAYATLVSQGVSTSKQKPGPENGGSWNFGFDIGVSLSGGVRWGDYTHVSDLQSTEKSFDVNGGPVDVSFIKPGDDGSIQGIEIGGGLSFGGGIGMKNTESKVLAFGDKSLDKLQDTLIDSVLKSTFTLGNTFIVPSLVETKTGIDLKITVYKLSDLKSPTGKDIFEKIFEETPIHFDKVNDDYYIAKDVSPKKK